MASEGVSAREASHIGFFDLAFAGRTDDAIAALQTHLTAWPRDALMVAGAANPNGLIGGSVECHSSGPQQKMTDGAAFLWRAELAGYPRDTAAWRALYALGKSALPRPGAGLAESGF